MPAARVCACGLSDLAPVGLVKVARSASTAVVIDAVTVLAKVEMSVNSQVL